MSRVSYRLFAPRDSEEMVDLQCKAYAMPRSQAIWFYEPGQVEALGAFSGERLVSALDIISFSLRLWDRAYSGGGIASVATHVEHRRQGHVAKLTRLALERMRERGMLVSVLHPFKRAFYRQFGWEHSVDLLHFTVPMLELAGLRSSGGRGASRFERLAMGAEGPVDMSVPARVYDAAVAGYNCANARGHEWKALARRLQKRMAGGSNVYAYAGFRGDRPVSYALYSINPGDGASVIRVTDGLAVDAPGWRDLLGFFGLHGEDAGSLDFYAPVDVPVRCLLPEAPKAYLQPSLMFRVVDVEGFLNGRGPLDVLAQVTAAGIPGVGVSRAVNARRATLEEPFCIGVSDSTSPWNDGVFQISFEGGAVHARKVQSGGPSLSTNIATFSQMASGYITPAQAQELGRLTAVDESALHALARVFPGRTTFTADFY